MSNGDNLTLWHAVEKTDPAFTKGFSRGGGFKGTAISPMYLIRKATEQWGPMGGKWGVRILSDCVLPGAPLRDKDGAVIGHEAVHCVQIELFHPGGAIPAYGQTMLVGSNKYGPFTDEEAPKKSLTDALTKALSWLGFAADVHMGLYDDNKYVTQIKADFEEEREREILREEALAIMRPAAAKGMDLYSSMWKTLSPQQRKAFENDHPALKELAQKNTRKEPANASS